MNVKGFVITVKRWRHNNTKDRTQHCHVELVSVIAVVNVSALKLCSVYRWKSACVFLREAGLCLHIGVHYGDDINYANSQQLR